ncbi:hypothetical protein QJS66_14390 [Kocuria rhizophila]|nr:hypothetical protein QJS66_14390 [Kocuria rhizophila]
MVERDVRRSSHLDCSLAVPAPSFCAVRSAHQGGERVLSIASFDYEISARLTISAGYWR